MLRIAFAIALASSCLTPVAAMAQETPPEGSDAATADSQATTEDAQAAAPVAPPSWSTNEITLGIQWVDGKNTGLFGRYNGLTYEGLDIFAAFEFSHRDPTDSGSTFYYSLTGSDLVVQTGHRLRDDFRDSRYRHSTDNDIGPEAAIDLNIGNQGLWGIDAGYSAITYTGNIINSIFTVDGTTATPNGIPAWGGASNDPMTAGPITSYTVPTLMEAEREFQTGTRRDIFHLDGKYRVGAWTIASGIRHEHKKGSLEQSLRQNYGGMAFTQPVDYDTDRFDISAAYNKPRLQAVAQFTYSKFKNHDLAVEVPWIVSGTSLTATSGPYAKTALYSLPPTNSAVYLTAMVGYNFAPRTRLTLNGRIGLEMQDDTFPANSANPGLSNTMGNPTYHWFDNLNSLNQGTVHNSPNAKAKIYQGNLSIDSSLTDRLEGRLSYVFDGRHVTIDERVPRGMEDEGGVFIGGGNADSTASRKVYVVPQNWFKQTFKAEATYHLRRASNTKLRVEYSYKDVDRTNAQVEHSRTHRALAQLSSMIGKSVMARLTYEHADRNGQLIYGTAWGNLEDNEPKEFDAPSGAYYQAPMRSNSITFRTDFAPAGKFSGGLFFKYADERFRYPSIPMDPVITEGNWTLVGHGEGIVRDYNLTVGPNVSYQPTEALGFHAYYTYERIFFDNRGNGACAQSDTGNCAGSVGYWQNKYTSSVHTAGVNAEWQASPKLKFLADYNMSIGSVMFGQFNGVMVPVPTLSYQNVVSYPDIKSRYYDLSLTADYQIAPNVEWALMYRFNKFHNNDWNYLAAPVQPTLDGGTTIAILTPGYPPPRYNVSVFGTAVRVRF